jgi:hypothetical protein
MHNCICRKLAFSYSEREDPHNSKEVVSEIWFCGVLLTRGFMRYSLLIMIGTVCDLHVFMHNRLNYYFLLNII